EGACAASWIHHRQQWQEHACVMIGKGVKRPLARTDSTNHKANHTSCALWRPDDRNPELVHRQQRSGLYHRAKQRVAAIAPESMALTPPKPPSNPYCRGCRRWQRRSAAAWRLLLGLHFLGFMAC
ncbi:unnamed protein product, partial [Sphacelaria rigidula]